MRFWVQDTWGPKHPLIALSLGLKIAIPRREECFFKLGEVSSLSGHPLRFGREVMLQQCHVIYRALDPDPNVNSWGP